jgi:hypothetical protein
MDTKNYGENDYFHNFYPISDELVVFDKRIETDKQWTHQLVKWDLKNRKQTIGGKLKGAIVPFYVYGAPSSKFFIYNSGDEYFHEECSTTEFRIYDLTEDKDYQLIDFCDFGKNVPELNKFGMKLVDCFGWIESEDRILSTFDNITGRKQDTLKTQRYLALFDVAAKKPVWLKPLKPSPVSYHYKNINNKTGLLTISDNKKKTTYELSLNDGEMVEQDSIVVDDADQGNEYSRFVSSPSGAYRLYTKAPVDIYWDGYKEYSIELRTNKGKVLKKIGSYDGNQNIDHISWSMDEEYVCYSFKEKNIDNVYVVKIN